MAGSGRQRGRFSALLVSLIITLVGTAFLDETVWNLPSLQLLVSAVFVAGVYAVSRHRRVLVGGSAIAALALIATWWRQFSAQPVAAIEVANYTADVIFFVYVASVVMRAVLEEERVTADTIYGGISVYLLIGLVWAVFYSSIEFFSPGSFVLGGSPVSELASDLRQTPLFRELIYFSFVTMTTLGYGDISPTTDVARMVSTAEAIVGQLFVAVFIARLVGLQLVHSRNGH